MLDPVNRSSHEEDAVITPDGPKDQMEQDKKLPFVKGIDDPQEVTRIAAETSARHGYPLRSLGSSISMPSASTS
jgi:hypothetical protein